jgi:hypothetical protein
MGKSWPAEVRDHETNAVTWEEGSSDWTRTSNPAIHRTDLRLPVLAGGTWP